MASTAFITTAEALIAVIFIQLFQTAVRRADERLLDDIRAACADEIVARYVTDVSSKTWTDAGSAFYVHGSSAKGPMRAGNLPAFASKKAALQFAAQRGGTVLAYADVDAGLVAQLGGQGTHAH